MAIAFSTALKERMIDGWTVVERTIAVEQLDELRQTHVVVGDHPPEPFAAHEWPAQVWCNYCQCHHPVKARCSR